jgi:small subunit ribosomal protein S15
MSIAQAKKAELIKEYGQTDGDTGSPEVQCAILTERILNLTEHMKANVKDFSSRRSLLILVARRRKLLQYVQKQSRERYEALIKRLGLRK